ncbi:NADH-quinone oxidoreductase subunit C [Desulfurispora thermophila]|uniref:NADH-quinone oxidoreductase subunit C n=1 Tax=Desulfurispora thermophila TaxID=265470 RepID=UPI00036469B8|nr:NADH-quinone oxidoreductase subunit C [Desulfurispora thermophila]
MAQKQLPAELLAALSEKFPGLQVAENQVITVDAARLLPLMQELKENPDYAMDYLTNLTGVDYADRFEMVYNLISFEHGYELMVKCPLPDKENPSVPSLCPLWGGANWQEREVYDLMGINFTGYPGHPTRIFLEDNFPGHPLRKDFQWEGGREA